MSTLRPIRPTNDEKVHLLSQSYPYYGLEQREPTFEELIESWKERLEGLELRAFGTASQKDYDALRLCERELKLLEDGYRPLYDSEQAEGFPPLDLENPYYQMPELNSLINF